MSDAAHDPNAHLHVEVFAPSEPKPRRFTFPTSETVGDAALKAATELGLHPTAPSFEIEASETVLDRGLTLAQAGIADGWRLELVDVGGGV